MTSLKSNFDDFVNKNNIQPKNQKSFKFQTLFKQNGTYKGLSEQQGLIQQIYHKNNALVKHSKHKISVQNHPNYLTFCQKYSEMLIQKYGTPIHQASIPNVKRPKEKENALLKNINQEEAIQKNLILLKRFAQNIHFQFDKQRNQLSVATLNLMNHLECKNNYFRQKQTQVQRQLLMLGMFMEGISKTKSKQKITPFSLFINEINNKSPSKSKQQCQQQKNMLKTPQLKLFSDKKMFFSNFNSPQSPDLLSGCRQNDDNNLLISFKKNLESSEKAYETLKYSESELNLKSQQNNHYHKDQRQFQRQNQIFQLPFSPVQPYRLHNLQKEGRRTDRIKQNEESLFHYIFEKDDIMIGNTFSQIQKYAKINTQNQTKHFSESFEDLSKDAQLLSSLLQRNHQQIQQQKVNTNQQWNIALQYIGREIEEIQTMLSLEKKQNDSKDRKFLQNLQSIQTELIQDIFAERQSRKQQEALLTQMLVNLVDSLQQVPQ